MSTTSFGRRHFLAGSMMLATMPTMASETSTNPVAPSLLDKFQLMLATEKASIVAYYVTRNITDDIKFSSATGVAASTADISAVRKSLNEWGDAMHRVVTKGLANSSPAAIQAVFEKQTVLDGTLSKSGIELNIPFDLKNGKLTDDDAVNSILQNTLILASPLAQETDSPTFMDFLNKTPKGGAALNDAVGHFVITAAHPETEQEAQAVYPKLVSNGAFRPLIQKDLDLVRQLNNLIRDGLQKGTDNAGAVVVAIGQNDTARRKNTANAAIQATAILMPSVSTKPGLGLDKPGAAPSLQPK